MEYIVGVEGVGVNGFVLDLALGYGTGVLDHQTALQITKEIDR